MHVNPRFFTDHKTPQQNYDEDEENDRYDQGSDDDDNDDIDSVTVGGEEEYPVNEEGNDVIDDNDLENKDATGASGEGGKVRLVRGTKFPFMC